MVNSILNFLKNSPQNIQRKTEECGDKVGKIENIF